MSYLDELTAKSGGLQGADLPAFYDRLEREHADVLGELEDRERDDPASALRMATLLQPFWTDRGYGADGLRRLQRILEHASSAPADERSAGLYAAGSLAFRVPDNATATRLFEESHALARAAADGRAEARALSGLARCALRERRGADAARLAEAAMRIERELGNESGMSNALHVMAYAAYVEGDDARARRLFLESIELRRRLGNVRGTAADYTNLGSVETRAGDLARAAEYCAEGLRIALDTNSAYLLPYCVANIGGVMAARGEHRRAARLLGAAEAMFERSGSAIDPGTAIEFERHTGNVRRALGPAFVGAWTDGRTRTDEEAIELARSEISASR